MLAMSETASRSRPSTQLRLGTQVCLILAALLLLFGIYQLIVPINMPTQQGVFGCGTGLKPPTESFAVGVCQDLASIQQLRAAFLGAAALLLGILGFTFFGADRVARAPREDEIDPADHHED